MNSQPPSPFFTLPKELRLQIYDLLFPPTVIHLIGRIDHSLSHRRLEGVRAPYVKISHTLCFHPFAEEEAHALSELPNEVHHEQADHVLKSYYTRHKPCLDLLRDLEENDYFYSIPNLQCDEDCRAFRGRGRSCSHFADMVKNYGPPFTGLRTLHPGTKLDLSFLLVCRQIYSEASLLPYKSTTFSFTDLDVVVAFAKHLSPPQVSAITSIQLTYWTVGMIQELKKTLAGLKIVSLDHSHTRSPESASDRRAYLGYSLSCCGPGLADVAKVIWSRTKGKDGWGERDEEREERRRDAEAVERAMTRAV